MKRAVPVPVIAVGRLGDPEVAMQAVDSGKVDFVALGRPLIADPCWPAKVRAGIPVRRCLACNTCVDEMRSGEQLGCVVNPAAAHELEYEHAVTLPQGERIAVIGAGPAGLAYAELVAASNSVTVFDGASRAGGALRVAGMAPRFQGVDAVQKSLDAYIDDLERACVKKNVVFRYRTIIAAGGDELRSFDRIVIATGATYRLGLGPLAVSLLESGWGKSRFGRWLLGSARVRNWFYYRARKSMVPALENMEGRQIQIIGDAASPGKIREAIASAFRAALTAAGVGRS